MTHKYTHNNIFHSIFCLLAPYRMPIFLVGMAAWLASPIIDIAPLLLFSQIQVSRSIVIPKSKGLGPFSLNTLSLILVFATLVICTCTFEIIADLKNYVELYNSLAKVPLFGYFEYFDELGRTTWEVEPLTFLVPKITSIIFGASTKNFILTQAITMNLVFMLLAMIFMPAYYPIIVLLNISSPSYFLQLFLMRQYYSFMFVVPVIYVLSLAPKLTLTMLGLFTHSSTIMFSLPAFLAQIANTPKASKRKQLQNFSIVQLLSGTQKAIMGKIAKLTKSKLFLLVAFPILVVSMPALVAVASNNAIVSQLFPRITLLANTYASGSNDLTGIDSSIVKLLALDFLLLMTSIVALDFKQASSACYSWSIVSICSAFYTAAFYSFLPAFGRLTFFLAGLSGFFYTVPLESGKLNNRLNSISIIVFLAIIVKTIYFNYRIVLGSIRGTSYIWSGNPLGTNALNYIEWLMS